MGCRVMLIRQKPHPSTGIEIANHELVMRMPRLLSLASLLLAIGCASEYAYFPTTNATATIQGLVAAEYPIPPDAPQGDVRIASYGIAEVSPARNPHQTLRALHLRVVVANDSATPWTFDVREQGLDVAGRGLLAPAFSSASAGGQPPLVTIDPKGKRVVDLFFVLPPDLQRASAIPEFDALWRVSTASGPIAQRTPFERLLVEPADYYGYWDYGPGYYWGGPYWVNPAFAFGGYPYAYIGPRIVVQHGAYSWYGWHGGGAVEWQGGTPHVGAPVGHSGGGGHR